MQKGMVDLVFTGCDRATRRGDVANKIGTYLKALAARASDVPFYVALPESTIDWSCAGGEHDVDALVRQDLHDDFGAGHGLARQRVRNGGQFLSGRVHNHLKCLTIVPALQ